RDHLILQKINEKIKEFYKWDKKKII
mgnify:CR=1